MKLKFKTDGIFTDITEKLKPTIKDGILVVSTQHTTCMLAILENESLLKKDMEGFLERIAPEKGVYAHDYIEKRDVPPDERINGFSHIRAMMFQPSLTIPVEDGKLVLGKWQTVFLIELDPKRERTLHVVEIEK